MPITQPESDAIMNLMKDSLNHVLSSRLKNLANEIEAEALNQFRDKLRASMTRVVSDMLSTFTTSSHMSFERRGMEIIMTVRMDAQDIVNTVKGRPHITEPYK